MCRVVPFIGRAVPFCGVRCGYAIFDVVSMILGFKNPFGSGLLRCMALIVDSGLRDIARLVLGLDTIISIKACLWTDDQMPECSDRMQTYTICTLPGYSSVNLNPNQWRNNSTACVAEYIYATIIFSFDAYAGDTVTIYGYLVQNISTQHLLWAEALLSPYEVPNAGGALPVTISLQLSNCEC